MAKEIYINGNTVVKVNGTELGYSEDRIIIKPNFHHTDVHGDDFGAMAPTMVLWMLCDVGIEMTLVYFDPDQVYAAWMASAGGTDAIGTFAAAGKLVTGVELTIGTDRGDGDWVFPKAYLAERPIEWPLGNERSQLKLSWRAVGLPTVAAEMLSAGTVIIS